MTTRPVTCGSSRLVRAKWPRWLVPNWSSKPSLVRDSGGIITPALLMSRSMGCACQSRREGAHRVEAGQVEQRGPPAGPGPGRVRRRPCCSPLAASRTARPPARRGGERPRAARPMPLLAPVTITVLPVRSGRPAVEKAAPVFASLRSRPGGRAQPVALSQRTGAPSLPGGTAQLIVPRAAEQPLQLLLQDRRAVGAEGERGAETVLRDEDVAVGARGGGEEPEVGRVA